MNWGVFVGVIECSEDKESNNLSKSSILSSLLYKDKRNLLLQYSPK
jgi:hypothetical protein